MRILNIRIGKKILFAGAGDLKVHIVNDAHSGCPICSLIGSHERANEIINSCPNLQKSSPALMIAELSKHCKHPNELAALSAAVGAAWQHNRNPLQAILTDLPGRRK